MLRRSALAIFAVSLLTMPVEAVDRRVRIHNETGLTMVKFYSTNSGATKWGSDVLGNSVLEPGGSIRLNFDNNEGYCNFDFRAVFEDGTDAQRGGINVCEIADYYYQP